jgi:tRNA U34 5-carboxymethylaminomethyl modifying GTPase MnmE/TrmE
MMVVQAESVAQLVSARTVAAADRALAGLRGGVGEAITAIRSDLIGLLAALEVNPIHKYTRCTSQLPTNVVCVFFF